MEASAAAKKPTEKVKHTREELLARKSAKLVNATRKRRNNSATINSRGVPNYIIVVGKEGVLAGREGHSKRGEYINDFAHNVRLKLAEGYQLQGGVTVDGGVFYQALTKVPTSIDLLAPTETELLVFGNE
jgi:hypothetical protein